MTHFNNTKIDYTKQICMCSFVSIIIIFIFAISPLKNFIMTSKLMKTITILILGYAIYLNIIQTNALKSTPNNGGSKEFRTQLNANIMCSYTFTAFLIILIFFIIKSMFTRVNFN